MSKSLEFLQIGQLDQNPDSQKFFVGPILPSARDMNFEKYADHSSAVELASTLAELSFSKPSQRRFPTLLLMDSPPHSSLCFPTPITKTYL